MESLNHAQQLLLGIGQLPGNLNTQQVCLRAIVIFVLALVMVRLGDKRFLSHKTAFDAVLGFIIASMLARAINGSSPFWQSIVAGFLLVGLHRLVGVAAQRWHSFGNLVKGHANIVIQDGAINHQTLREHHLSEHDLTEDLRLNGNVDSPARVKLAYYERNGQISVVKKE